jgi:putative phosphonate metabolism protein
MRRLAIYYAPAEDSPLSRTAVQWLGRDAFADLTLPGAKETVIADPRVYGFHATLKPPFRLASGADESYLRERLRQFASSRSPFEAPPLQLGSLSSFLALTLSKPCPVFQELAAACVREFDRFRAPATEQEMARRRRAKLNPSQLAYLEQWGYPYVLDEWRFHMTLTSSLDPDTYRAMRKHLAELFEPHCQAPLRVDSICLFEQFGDEALFRALERYPFR